MATARIGRYQVDIFSDGIFKLDGGQMFGIVPKVFWQKHKTPDELNRISMDMSCLLIRDTDGHVVVVETGAGAQTPFLIEERARLARDVGDSRGAARLLREAQRAFAEMGAAGHAARLADEIGG